MKKDPQITVLVYHRIDTVATDPWGICVPPHVFEEQIRYISTNYPVSTVAEVVGSVCSRTIGEHSICITFDDGYADNYLQAKPILERYNCPATFFISTAFIGTAEPFWWDELEYVFLHIRRLPQQLKLTINENNFQFDLKDCIITEDQWLQHQRWRWYDNPPTDRCSLFLTLYELLRPLPHSIIQEQLAFLREWAGSQPPPGFRAPMNHQQLQAHFSNPLFTAGLHTHSHPDLAVTEERWQLREIEACKQALQSLYNLCSSYLAYPYGRHNQATLAVVEQLHLAACFTTEAAPVDATSDKAKLGRYQVCNWGLDEFKTRLSL